MDSLTFPDNSARLFGREPDLAFLAERAQHSGLTAILGRPKMGKSWLLTELARRLSSPNSAPSPLQSLSLGGRPESLVGLSEQEGSTPDHMLRAVVDLYTRWLADSTYRQQAQLFYEQHKSDLVGKTGEAVGSIFKELGGLLGKPGEKLGGIVKGALDALAAGNRDLVSGGLQLPRLQTEQARDLLNYLHTITSRRIVLILDQWEKSPNLGMEINILDAFHRHLEDWPPCHIFLGVRAGNEIRARLQEMHGGFSYERPIIGEPMGIYDIPPMDLKEDEKVALPAYLRRRFEEATKLSGAMPPEISNEKLLEMIGGFPYVIDQWTRPYILPKLTSIERLQEQVVNANNERYSEFEAILRQLNDSERTVAIRLALVPFCVDPDFWKVLRPIILEGLNPGILDKLKDLYVLETTSPPSYGHATQLEAACRWFAKKQSVSWSDTCEQLIFSLAAKIAGVNPGSAPYATALGGILFGAKGIAVSRTAQALLESTRALFSDSYPDASRLIGIVPEIGVNQTAVIPLLAMGLYNTLDYAKTQHDLTRRDALLEELRGLAGRYHEGPVVRDRLAWGLYNALYDAQAEQNLARWDALLEELRVLAGRHPEDTVARVRLARGLYNTLYYAKAEQDLALQDALLEELRGLAGRYPEDAAIREQLARGLLNTLDRARAKQDLARRDVLLEELRVLAGRNPDDAAVRENLALGLFGAINNEEDLLRRYALLEELRTLAGRNPEDAAVRKYLAWGLFNTFLDENAQQDLAQRDALLEELRTLAGRYPDDVDVREQFAMGLFKAFEDARAQQDLGRQDSLLEELRTLASTHPGDEAANEAYEGARALLE